MISLRAFWLIGLAGAILMGFASAGVHAQDRDVPYWASLRFNEVNMRVGPSQDYPIDWVYKRQGYPVQVVRLREGWRLVRDHQGTQGWIAASQLTPTVGAMIVGEGLADLREGPGANTTLRWRAQPGVVGKLLRCAQDACEIDVDGRTGWVRSERLWGVGDGEPATAPEIVPEDPQ